MTVGWIAGQYPNRGGVDVFDALRLDPGDAFTHMGRFGIGPGLGLASLFDRLLPAVIGDRGIGLRPGIQFDIVESSCRVVAAQCSSAMPDNRRVATTVFATVFGEAFGGDAELWVRAVLLAPTWDGAITSLARAVTDMSASAGSTPDV